MKRLILLITYLTTVFCACSGEDNTAVSDNVTGAPVSGTAIEYAVSENKVMEPTVSESMTEENGETGLETNDTMTVILAKKDGPMLSEKVDSTQKGIELPYYPTLATNPIKGDDGNCYYFRYQGGKKEGKLTFYMNNAIKVCETVLPEKYHKRDYFITSFLKLGEQFWLQFETYEYENGVLVPVRIKDGKWGDAIKLDDFAHVIYYKDCFYFFDEDSGKIEITDRDGNRRSMEFESEKKRATLQTIIDDKLYYIVITETNENIIMRCNMDGSQKEELFRYYGVPHGVDTDRDYSRLTIDGDYMYLFEPCSDFMLTRIPLYGGEVEKIVTTDRYVLTEDSIYYLDGKGTVRRMSKNQPEQSETLTIKGEYQVEEPLFVCDDGHLLMVGYNKEEEDILGVIWHYNSYYMDAHIGMNYSNECYLVSESGEVDAVIPGSGISKKHQEFYERTLPYVNEDCED